MANTDDKRILFSVIVPVYNVEDYLNECLESIIPQALDLKGEVEIIVIDDGSTDSSGKICDEYAKKYSAFIRCFHKQNEGLLLTRRFSFKKACGEYIVNCDSDDVLEADTLQALKDVIEKYDRPDVIFFNYASYCDGEKLEIHDDTFQNALSGNIDRKLVLQQYFDQAGIVSLCLKTFKRSCLNIDKDYSEYAWVSNGEDSLQSIEIYDKAKTFFYLNKCLYNYRVASGMTAKFNPKYLASLAVIADEIDKRKDNWDLSDFDERLAIKRLTTIRRAITQSRFKKWEGLSQWRQYLLDLYNSDFFQKYSNSEYCRQPYLDKKYISLIKGLKQRHFYVIIATLKFKNTLERIRGNR